MNRLTVICFEVESFYFYLTCSITVMKKNQRQRENIENLKEEFRHLDTDVIVRRLINFRGSNDFSIAYKEMLKERGVDDYLQGSAVEG